MNFVQIYSAIDIGIIYSLVVLAIYLTFRVINFSDLTIEGSFTLGASISSILVISGYNELFALLIAFLCGCTSGYITSLLNYKLKMADILSSILVMTALYSINLRIMKQPNLSLFGQTSYILPGENNFLVLSLTIIFFFSLIILFFRTEAGLSMRAVGINEKCATSQGININKYKSICLAISNGICAVSGAIMSFYQGFADISMGTGTLVIGLASLIIGEKILKSNFYYGIFACIIGSILYRLFITFALNADFLELSGSDLNLITSIIIIIFIGLSKIKKIGKQI